MNHAITIEELFTNTPKKVIDKKWRWYVVNFNTKNSIEEGLSYPFKYALVLILNKMLEDKMRFILPVTAVVYWDFKTYTEDDFVKHRQLGRFQDIDFVYSDFSAYTLEHTYVRNKLKAKSLQMYLGGELKERMNQKINSGEKMYSIKDFKIYEILPQVYEKFPQFTKKEINNIIKFGFSRLHTAIRYGCYVKLNTTVFQNFYIFIGKFLTSNIGYVIKMYSNSRDRKLRKIHNWKKLEFEDTVYVGLSDEGVKDWLELNEVSRTICKFRNITYRRLKEELFYKHKALFIFKIDKYKNRSWVKRVEKIDSRCVTYLGKVTDRQFKEDIMTWKEFKKQYEKGIS